MALMQWDDTMSVGVEELDNQHKELIGLINESYEAIQKQDAAILAGLIDKMRNYALQHFATEEKYMSDNGFPELEHHKFEHARFNDEVFKFKKELYGKTNFSQVFVFLSRWLTSHIMDEDMQYVPYMPKAEDAQKLRG